MKLDSNDLENILFEYADQIKMLISPELWENVLLNCSKNEIFILMLLYRGSEVNMTQIADYINVPLNTATGIVARMEQKQMVSRVRSEEDKRVVTIVLTQIGIQQLQDIIKEFIYYGQKIMVSLTASEIEAVGSVLDKVLALLQEERFKEDTSVKKVRKITIN